MHATDISQRWHNSTMTTTTQELLQWFTTADGSKNLRVISKGIRPKAIVTTTYRKQKILVGKWRIQGRGRPSNFHPNSKRHHSAANCSISVTFGTEFDQVTPCTTNVQGQLSKVIVTVWKHRLTATLLLLFVVFCFYLCCFMRINVNLMTMSKFWLEAGDSSLCASRQWSRQLWDSGARAPSPSTSENFIFSSL